MWQITRCSRNTFLLTAHIAGDVVVELFFYCSMFPIGIPHERKLRRII